MHVCRGRQREVWARCLRVAEAPWWRPTIYQNLQSSHVYDTAAFRCLLPRSVAGLKHIPRISEQTAQCGEMLPASLPFPLPRWWGHPSPLLQRCPSPTSNQLKGKIVCLNFGVLFVWPHDNDDIRAVGWSSRARESLVYVFTCKRE